MKFWIPLSIFALMGCVFESSKQAEANLLNQVGINKDLPRDSISIYNLKNTASSLNQLSRWIKLDSNRAMVLGIDTLGQTQIKQNVYFRVSTTDSAQVFLNQGDTVYLKLRVDSIPKKPISIQLSWSQFLLPKYNQTLSATQTDSIDAAFFKADSIWYQQIQKIDNWQTITLNPIVDTNFWLTIPLPNEVLNSLKSAQEFRQGLDLKLETDNASILFTHNATKKADTAKAPRLIIGSKSRLINRTVQRFDFTNSKSSIWSNLYNDTLKISIPTAVIRQALQDSSALINQGDSVQAPLILSAQLSLEGIQKSNSLFAEPTRIRTFYQLDSSLYNGKAIYFESQYDSSAYIFSKDQNKIQIQIASALSRALLQANRMDTLKLALLLSNEITSANAFRTRRSLAVTEYSSPLPMSLKLVYSKQNGYYTKELK